MSHFALIVVTDERPTKELLAEALLPWHEHETTGEDRYCVWKDHTEEVMREWAEKKEDRYRGTSGKLYTAWDDRFHRDPTPEEQKKIGLGGSGWDGELSWHSKDWGDGRGYRAKVRVDPVPLGYEKLEVPVSQLHETVGEYAKEEHGYEPIPGQPGRFGRFTNPDSRWDWWQIGGRYEGRLRVVARVDSVRGERSRWDDRPPLERGRHDGAKKGDLDWAAMRADRAQERRQWAEDCCKRAVCSVADLNVACRAAPAVDAAWQALPEPRPRGKDYYDWATAQGNEEWATYARVARPSFDLPETKGLSVEDWIASAPALSALAVVMDGKWHEKGHMLMFGCLADEKAGWEEQFQGLIDSVRPEQWLTFVDCHI